jgi:hypothetical protein
MASNHVDEKFEIGDLDDEYAAYIMEHAIGDRIICNGHTLLAAMEDGYLSEEFEEIYKHWLTT